MGDGAAARRPTVVGGGAAAGVVKTTSFFYFFVLFFSKPLPVLFPKLKPTKTEIMYPRSTKNENYYLWVV